MIVAANLCFEPVVGTLIRRELGTRAAAANGDSITPVLARAETQEWEWTRAWSTELRRFLMDDAQHGAENRRTLTRWIEDWLPQAMEAALALAPVAERIPAGIDVEQAIERIRRYTGSLLSEAGVPELGALVGVEPDGQGATPSPAAARATRVRPARQRRPAPRRSDPATREDGTYDFVGIVMAKSAEGDAVAEVLGRRDDIEVLEQASFWDIRARDRLELAYAEVSEELGYEINAYSIQHEMSTHYGRLIASDDALMLFSDPTEAMQYLMS